MIFEWIILNVHNDPCFEDKSSSLNNRPLHFSENICSLVVYGFMNQNEFKPNLD